MGWNITGEQSSTIEDLCNNGIDVDGTNIKDCRQLNAIEGWTWLNHCASWLNSLAVFILLFAGRNASRLAQMMSFLSSSCLLGAILWFSLDSPLCTGQGIGLGLSMQIDVVVMLVQFAVLFGSILFDKKLNGDEDWMKNYLKILDEIIKTQSNWINLIWLQNIAAKRK